MNRNSNERYSGFIKRESVRERLVVLKEVVG